jgi:hypothetical protein
MGSRPTAQRALALRRQMHIFKCPSRARVAQWARSLDLTTHTSLSSIRRGFAPSFVNNKKGALDSQPQVIKFTSCLPRVGGSLRVLRLPPPLKLVAMIYPVAEILLKVALNTKIQKFNFKCPSHMCLDLNSFGCTFSVNMLIAQTYNYGLLKIVLKSLNRHKFCKYLSSSLTVTCKSWIWS